MLYLNDSLLRTLEWWLFNHGLKWSFLNLLSMFYIISANSTQRLLLIQNFKRNPDVMLQCLCPPKFICWSQTLQVVAGGNFGRDLDHVGIALKNRSNALVKENNLVTSTMWVSDEKSASQKRAFARTWPPNPAGTLFMDFQPQELYEINVCSLIATPCVVFCYSCTNRMISTMFSLHPYGSNNWSLQPVIHQRFTWDLFSL